MDITKEDFINLSIKEQINKIKLYHSNIKPLYDYIFSNENLLHELGKECIDNPYFFDYYFDEEMQKQIIFHNLDYLKKQASSVQMEFLEKIKDEEIFNYLFKYLNIKEQLVYLQHDDILEFLTCVKNKQLFLEIYHDPEIFKRLMEEIYNKQFHVGIFFYYSMKKLPLEHQIYILKDLKGKEEYQKQYEGFLEYAVNEAKITVLDNVPNDIRGQILYYRLTRNNEVKNLFMKSIINNNISDDETFKELISLYPEYIGKEDLAIIVNNTCLFLLANDKIIKQVSEDEAFKKIFKEKVLSEKTIEGYYFRRILPVFEDEEEQKEIISKLSKKDILFNNDIPEIKKYLQEKLANDQNFLKDIDPDSLYSRSGIDEYLPFLSDEAFIKAAPLPFNGEPIYLNKIISLIEKNPSLINYLNDKYALAWINILDYDSNIYQKMPTSCLLESFKQLDDLKKKQIIIDEICRRSFKYESDLSSNISAIYDKLDKEEKKIFINNVNPKYLLYCYVNSKDDEELKEILAQMILKNEKEIFDENIEGYHYFLKLSDVDVLRILINVSPIVIVKLYDLSPSKLLENLFLKNFEEDCYLLSNAEYCDEFVYSLSLSAQKVVNDKLQELLNDFKQENPQVYELIKNNDSYSVLNFLEKYHDGFFNDELKREVFFKILKKYPLITKTINYDILSDEFLHLNSDFLEKIVKYPDIQKRIIDIKKKKSNSYPLFLALFQKIAQQEARVFEEQLLYLLSFFKDNDLTFDHELSEKELNNLLRYILVSSKVFSFSEEPLNVDNIDPLNYEEEIDKICDEEYRKSQNILDFKNVIFKKYFDMSYEDAKTFLFTFDNNIERLEIQDEIKNFVNNIKLIVNLKDIFSLKRIYESSMPRYTINDILCIINELKKAYTKKISDGLTKNFQEKKTILVNGEEIEVFDAGVDFTFLAHSTNAYSSMPMIDDDYYKSWNAGKNLSNHGICTALVSDTCLGLPPLKDEEYGVIFGFNHINENGVSNMAPYDLSSMNSDYQLETRRISKFMDGEDTQDATRHTHSEIVVERINFDGDEIINIQPDFVIITSEMTERQKQNAVKAAGQMNNGKGIPIVYVDIARIVEDKKNKIYDMLKQFTQSKDLNIFAKALSLYESIKCTLFTIEKYNFIQTKEMDDIISNYISYTSTLEPSEKASKLKKLERILDNEKAKFDLVNDTGHRFRQFDINYQEHITSIYDSIISINLENDEERLEEYLSEANDQKTSNLSAHDESHMVRVTMLSQKICELLGLDERLVIIALEAAKNHDKGRVDDQKGIGHGEMGAQRYKQISTLDENITNMICTIIEYHEANDDEKTLEKLFNKYQIKPEDKETLKLLCMIVKDADALDRVRFTNPKATLDPRKLRLKESKLLLKYAHELLNKTQELQKEEYLDATLKA